MKSEDWVLALTAGLVIYLLNEKQKDSQIIFELQNQNRGYAHRNKDQNLIIIELDRELKKTVENKEYLSHEIKSELKKLISDFDKYDKNISKELISISSLIEIDEKPKAIFAIAKIIENLLKAILDSDGSFYALIELTKSRNVLTIEEYHFTHGIREIRNKEGHDLNVSVNKYLTASSFLIGIGIITKLSHYQQQL